MRPLESPKQPGGITVDFKLFTGTLKAYETESGDRYVSGTTSSTIRDLHGDAMAMSALKSMEDTAKQNMTVFLNHNYNVPEDLFGSATDARIVKRMDEETGQEVYDLDIDVKVCPEDENPQAMQAYRAIKRGVKLGLSIGARVENADKKRDEKSGIDTYVINKVRLLEASVVGIPANQRSYLHNAVKSLRSKPEENEVEHAIIRDLTDAVKVEETEGQQAAGKNKTEDSTSAELEKNMTEEIAPQVAEETPEVAPEAEPAVAVEPAVEAAVEAAVEPVAEEAAADVEEYREVSEADVAEVLASATSNRLALETGAPLQGVTEAPVAEPVAAEPVAEEVAVEAAPAEAAPIDAVIEEPVAELASEDQGVEPIVDLSEAEKSSDVDDIGKIVEVAKSALDAAKTAQQEVETLRKEITELAAAKAKVEKDLESAMNVIDRLSAEPVGRKLISKATEQRHSDATWLHPYIQRVLEAQD
jgi:HK97 family phage prohead protease